MGSNAENPILTDEEQVKENSPPHPTSPLSKRRTQTPLLGRSRLFATRIENASDYDNWKLFE